MSLINDALKQAENAKLDKLSEPQSPPEMPSATYGQSTRRRLLGPITVVCLLVIGGGLVAYRYWGPGDGPGPQAATADSNTPPPPTVTPAPTEPKTTEWINPAFKDLTPQAANAIRAEVAESVVKQFFNAGSALNDYAASLGSARPARVKPPVKTVGPTVPDIGQSDPPKPPVAPPAKPEPKPEPKPKVILSAAAAGVDPTAFHVNGIMFNGANSMAVINEGVYRVGQKVSGAVVENITPTAVILRIGDKTFRVGM